jgi:hypothetical protein
MWREEQTSVDDMTYTHDPSSGAFRPGVVKEGLDPSFAHSASLDSRALGSRASSLEDTAEALGI